MGRYGAYVWGSLIMIMKGTTFSHLPLCRANGALRRFAAPICIHDNFFDFLIFPQIPLHYATDAVSKLTSV